MKKFVPAFLIVFVLTAYSYAQFEDPVARPGPAAADTPVAEIVGPAACSPGTLVKLTTPSASGTGRTVCPVGGTIRCLTTPATPSS